MPDESPNVSGPRQRCNVVGGLARTYSSDLVEVQTDGPYQQPMSVARVLALRPLLGPVWR